MALTGLLFSGRRSRRLGLRRWLVIAGLCVLPTVAMAAPDKARPESAPDRPKIGLVLAGGGAKGAAHIGVLKVLEELRIPIDYVAGTSMGAVVGGLYATGMSAKEIEQEVQRIDWDDIFVDSPQRQDLSFRRKTDDLLYMFKAKPGFKDGELQVPLGVIRGQKFDLQLSRLTQQVADVHDFDRLPIPFRAVATDLETGQEVVLGSGNLSRAIRASLAVPGAFGPVEIDGRILVDGGLSNNVPVSVARSMGADVVIVSDLGSDLYTREELTSGVAVGLQMINFLFALNSQEQLNSLSDADALISVALGDISPTSFDRIAEAIPRGEEAARQAADALRKYALDGRGYSEYQRRQVKEKVGSPVIAFVRIENQSSIGDEVIASYITASAGSQLDVAKLETEIQQIYGLDLFESVRYELVDEDGGQGLVIRVKEKPWGPAYLQAGLITSTNFAGDSAFRLGLAYTRTQINTLNGEWRIAAEIGDAASVFAEIFQPLDPAARYFGFGRIGLEAEDYYGYDSAGNSTAKYRTTSYGVELGAGRQFGTWGELRLGYLRQHGDTEVSTGVPAPDYSFDIGELFVRMTDDKLDSVYFPTKGHAAVAEWRIATDWLGSDSDYQQARLDYFHAYSWGRNSLFGSVGLRTTFEDNAPIERAYRLGGFLQLSGFDTDRLTGQHSGLARAIFLHRVADAALAETYLGASIEYGNVWQDSSDISLDDGILAGSLFLGVDLPIGPLYLGYGYNDASEGSIYLYLGPLFSF